MARLVCWNCGTDLKNVPRPISRHSNCPECYEVLHCCRMCRHYAPSIQGECDHDEADPPVRKESPNLCSYFKPRFGAFKDEEGKRKSAAKSRFAALFDEENESGGPSTADDPVEPEKEDEIRAKLNELFSDDD